MKDEEKILKEYWEALRGIYLEQKKDNQVYMLDGINARAIIQFFYTLMPDAYFNLGLKKFKQKYVSNETRFEENKYNLGHTTEEREGLLEMYNYIENFKFDENSKAFSVQVLMMLHSKLYSKSSVKGVGGILRTESAHLKNSPVELVDWSYIPSIMQEKRKEYDEIMATEIKTVEDIISYIDKCSEFTTKLLQVHPFVDGNGRSIRGLQNLMFKKANIPPVYVAPKEKDVYAAALAKAQNENDYSDIKVFYYYKVCDSLFELTKSRFSSKTTVGNKTPIK